MIISAKNYTKKTKKRTERTLGQMVKAKLYRQNHKKKHSHTHKKRKRKKNIYLYIKKEESKLDQYTNLLMIINSKYYTQINIKPETNYMQKANPKPTVAPKVYCLNLG